MLRFSYEETNIITAELTEKDEATVRKYAEDNKCDLSEAIDMCDSLDLIAMYDNILDSECYGTQNIEVLPD